MLDCPPLHGPLSTTPISTFVIFYIWALSIWGPWSVLANQWSIMVPPPTAHHSLEPKLSGCTNSDPVLWQFSQTVIKWNCWPQSLQPGNDFCRSFNDFWHSAETISLFQLIQPSCNVQCNQKRGDRSQIENKQFGSELFSHTFRIWLGVSALWQYRNPL